jgi:hypothetical protein
VGRSLHLEAPGALGGFLCNTQTLYATLRDMARLSITEAARVAGVARSTLYRAIRDGRLSREPDGMVDTSELLRAGFTLQHATPDATPHSVSTLHGATPGADVASDVAPATAMAHLERLVATLERELEAAKAREADLLALLKTAALPPARVDLGTWSRFRAWFWGKSL